MVKLAQGIPRLADGAEPRLRMPFGSDTLARVEAKTASGAAELAGLVVGLGQHRLPGPARRTLTTGSRLVWGEGRKSFVVSGAKS
jgi:hypothetical protein